MALRAFTVIVYGSAVAYLTYRYVSIKEALAREGKEV